MQITHCYQWLKWFSIWRLPGCPTCYTSKGRQKPFDCISVEVVLSCSFIRCESNLLRVTGGESHSHFCWESQEGGKISGWRKEIPIIRKGIWHSVSILMTSTNLQETPVSPYSSVFPAPQEERSQPCAFLLLPCSCFPPSFPHTCLLPIPHWLYLTPAGGRDGSRCVPSGTCSPPWSKYLEGKM